LGFQDAVPDHPVGIQQKEASGYRLAFATSMAGLQKANEQLKTATGLARRQFKFGR
jgi:hypothetical protein